MEKNLFGKYQKSKWQTDDFGRGKSKNAKRRHKNKIKARTKNLFKKDLNKEDYEGTGG